MNLMIVKVTFMRLSPLVLEKRENSSSTVTQMEARTRFSPSPLEMASAMEKYSSHSTLRIDARFYLQLLLVALEIGLMSSWL